MSTRCLIALQLDDNNVKYIYCHHDGYPKHMLNILNNHYNTNEKIEELFSLGDLSSIDTTTQTCCAYHRDMNEDWNTTRPFIVPIKYYYYDILDSDTDVQYLYLFNNNEWSYKEKKKDISKKY
jgi:hypothetical protein